VFAIKNPPKKFFNIKPADTAEFSIVYIIIYI